MKKRGFTLIELLAVIVILAIIALIATPIVMNVIEKSKQKSAEASMDQIERAAELYFYNSKVQGEFLQTTFTCTNGTCKSGDKFLEISGKGPESGTIIINQNGEVSMSSMVIDGFACVKAGNGYSCTKYKSKDASTTNGVITLKDVDDASLNDYKIYGNSVEASDGSSKSVGELVTDQNDPNYGKYVISVKASGKNLYLCDNSVLVSHNANWHIRSYQLKPNTTYTASLKNCDMSSWTKQQKEYVCGVSELSGLNGVVNYVQIYEDKITTFTTDETGLIKIRYSPSLSGKLPVGPQYITQEYKDFMDSCLQIEEGDTVTDYEPYQELTTNIYLDEPLTTNDYIDYKNQELSKNGVITKIELPSMQLFKGYNNIIVDTNVTPSNMTVNYYSSLK